MRDFLTELVVAAEHTSPGTCCGLTLVRAGGPTLLASSDRRATDLEQIQYEHGGPLMAAAELGKPVLVEIDDVAKDDHWSAYLHAAATATVRSSLHVGVIDDDQTVVLGFYSPHARAFGPAEQRAALQYAEEADRSLALMVRLSNTERAAWHLEAALDTRSTIAQAVGVIMAENRCDADTAFGILKTASQNRNIKLREIAKAVIDGPAG